jgi:ubiquinone/menaquinone biosynthesis C-methylase UbiE
MSQEFHLMERVGEKHKFYDSYNYSDFWLDRDYENRSEAIVLANFFKKINHSGGVAVDVGGGMGRLTPYYAPLYGKKIILDPSLIQLDKAKSLLAPYYPNLSFVHGIAQKIPLADNEADLILCVRVFHHVKNSAVVINECARVLAPGGYLILEVANKLHAKNRFKALMTGNVKKFSDPAPVQVNSDLKEKNVLFLNHNPHTIEQELQRAGFKIVAKRSVSNFRLNLFKKLLPLDILLIMERLAQPRLASIQFGPSMFFLAKKIDKN